MTKRNKQEIKLYGQQYGKYFIAESTPDEDNCFSFRVYLIEGKSIYSAEEALCEVVTVKFREQSK